MLEFENKIHRCAICKHEYTSKHIMGPQGEKVYVCEGCQEATRDNFISICFNCGKVYISPKAIVLSSEQNAETIEKYSSMMMIQQVETCTGCSHDAAFNYSDLKKHSHGVHKRVTINMPEYTSLIF